MFDVMNLLEAFTQVRDAYQQSVTKFVPLVNVIAICRVARLQASWILPPLRRSKRLPRLV